MTVKITGLSDQASEDFQEKERDFMLVLQSCPVCREKISAYPGSKGAICRNCGFKDPCCE